MQSVPVSWLSRDGSNRLQGVLLLDAGTLVLQYQTRDWHQGALHSRPRELRLGAESIVLARFAAGVLWRFPRIEVQASDFAALARLDADQSGLLQFKVRSAQRRAAKALVEELTSALAEVRYSRWTRDIDRLAPNAQASASDEDTAPPP